ncbi:MAG: DNA mismatch repair endonuclease MutL [Negativicutes bacterium]|nr:DNA mismatch repair endonuclease MutL [Negativicutes bacterium]
MTTSIIRVLDQNTANQIAAGEVVERPASVVKELVENALDAYSRNIEVTVADGGTSIIRVVDDGVGMSPEDAELSVLRHATSKIDAVDDLYSVHSLGFRGEALPSIASVSRFTLTTRLHDAQLATYVEVTGGMVTDTREAGGGVGTTISVSDLFYNTPARRKFLKTPSTESSYINDIIAKLALSHPEVAFKLLNNQRLVLSTPGGNNLLDTMASLYGPKVSEEVFPLRYEEDGLTIGGYVAKPSLVKSSRQWQTFIVNTRVIHSRMIAKAVDNAYHSLLPKSGYPLVVLNISLPPDTIDVNVHPQKSEIKFRDEGRIFKAVYHAINQALSTPEAAQAATPAPVWQAPVWRQPLPEQSVTQAYPVSNESVTPVRLWREDPPSLTTVRESLRQEEPLTGRQEVSFADNQSDEENGLVPIGQIENCYIVASGPDGLYIIDQHAAHERVYYDRLSRSSGRIPVQQLLIPLLLDFDSREMAIIDDNLALFYELGFTLETVGPNAMRLTEMPADFSPADGRGVLQDILTLVQKSQEPSAATLRHAYLQTAACRAAVKAGDHLNMRQLQALVTELNATSMPYTCPHGRPTIIKFSSADLAKMFKRT